MRGECGYHGNRSKGSGGKLRHGMGNNVHWQVGLKLLAVSNENRLMHTFAVNNSVCSHVCRDHCAADPQAAIRPYG